MVPRGLRWVASSGLGILPFVRAEFMIFVDVAPAGAVFSVDLAPSRLGTRFSWRSSGQVARCTEPRCIPCGPCPRRRGVVSTSTSVPRHR